jgi:hypothetical protein
VAATDAHAGENGITATHPPCCPELPPDTTCDVLDFRYRLTHDVAVSHQEREVSVPVDVVIHARLERCPGPLTQGDLVYTTTLFPGEKVRLFTTDRRSHFMYDSASQTAYRNQHASEERSFMASISRDMSNLVTGEITETPQPAADSGSSGGLFGGLAGTLVSVATLGVVHIDGSHKGSSTGDFLHELREHSEQSCARAEVATRAINSISVGEVQTRTHSTGESEDHFESGSREFNNPNRCHAVSYYFYQVNKTQTVRFSILSVSHRVRDPAAPSSVSVAGPLTRALTSVIPHMVLSTDANRLEQEATDRASGLRDQAVEEAGRRNQIIDAMVQKHEADSRGQLGDDLRRQIEEIGRSQSSPDLGREIADLSAVAAVVGLSPGGANMPTIPDPVGPFPEPVRQKALEEVAADLITAGILDPDTLTVAPGLQRELSWEKQSSLPTGGTIVTGCLDSCDTCEPLLQRQIELELERQSLENDLLRKQVELLEKSQEYRCCPADESSPV